MAVFMSILQMGSIRGRKCLTSSSSLISTMEDSSPIPKLRVKDVMLPIRITINGERSVREAAIMMDRLGISSLLVVEEGKVVGIVTERDLVRRVLATSSDASKTKVKDIMSYPLVVTTPETPLEDAITLMVSNGFRRLPVVDEKNNLLGMLTMSVALQALVTTQKAYEEVLKTLLNVAKTEEEKSLAMYG